MPPLNPAMPAPRSRTGEWLAAAIPPLLFLMALAVLHPNAGNTNDVSWLISVGERMLDGKGLYTDIIEVNPPASEWLYFPFIALSRWIPVSAEALINFELFALTGLMLWASAAILKATSARTQFDAPIAIWGAATMLVLVPAQMHSYGQREQFGAIFLLPMLAMTYARLERASIDWRLAVTAGVCAGMAMCIKPYFAAALAPPMLVAALHQRPLSKAFKALFPLEFWLASLVVITYSASIYVLYPAYFSKILPLIASAYLPVHDSWSNIFIHPALINLVFLIALSFALTKLAPRTPAFMLLASASLGAFFGLVVLPHKSFFYHYTPAISLAGTMAFLLISSRPIEPFKKLIEFIGILALQLSFYTFLGSVPVPSMVDLTAAVARLQPNPTLLEIGNYTSGFPLTRKVHGHWVGSLYIPWATYGAHLLTERATTPMPASQSAALDHAKTFERDLLLKDIAREKPQIILVQTLKEDWRPWIARHPDIAAALAPYAVRGTYDHFEIWQRTAP
ncbi:MAG: hypothetical protein KGQ46_05780 [Hyphomicrobiales bacterium]|nr:hypothetical protein [Hyphomicrobiales bacterium]MDE2115670.1 hypothetical protein [Hyphomicrobiales bacterium]